MNPFVCQFHLIDVHADRDRELVREGTQPKKDENGEYVYEVSPVVGTKFRGVQGEPFGRYTPNAEASLTIKNPAVAEALEALWHEHCLSRDPNKHWPRFEVTFRLIEE